MNALRLEIATPDIVLNELNQIKKEREVDEKRFDSLIQTKENIDTIDRCRNQSKGIMCSDCVRPG